MTRIFDALAPRTKENVPGENGSFVKAFCVILPILVYYVVDGLVFMCGAKMVNVLAGMDVSYAGSFVEHSKAWSVAISFIAKIVGVLCVTPLIVNEKPIIIGTKLNQKWTYMSAILGASMALFVNFIFNILGVFRADSEATNVAQSQLSLNLFWGILLYGIVSPIIEEIVFRGGVYNRFRRNYGIYVSVIMSSLIFGLYHGNLSQSIYGAFMGLFLAWVYERFGGLIYPILVHVAANTAVYTMVTLCGDKYTYSDIPVLFIIAGVIAILAIIFIAKETKVEKDEREII